MQLTVMSYNVQHCRNYISGVINYDAVAEIIQKYNADIIGLNEIRGEGPLEGYDAQAQLLADRLGYYYYFAKAIDVGGENPYGNALLSRFPIVDAQTIPVPDPETPAVPGGPYETRCLLKAASSLPGSAEDGSLLTLCVTHFGLNIDEQENAAATVLANISQEKCILMGDFNITPDNPLLAPIRAQLYDTAALLPEHTLSFPSDKPEIKIDYMFTSNDIRVKEAQIPPELTSDHRPYVITIDL